MLSNELATVLNLLQTAREPRSTAELWDEITTMRLATPCKDMPATVGILANRMMDLCLKGYTEERQGRWHILPPKPAKVERALF
jgi:hypothetical protein